MLDRTAGASASEETTPMLVGGTPVDGKKKKRKYRPCRKLVNRCLDICGRFEGVFEMTMRLLGWMLGLLAIVLISLVTYGWFTEVYPFLSDEEVLGPTRTLAVTFIGIWLLGNIVFNHQMANWSSPGLAKRQGELPTYSDETMKRFAVCPELRPNENIRWCKTCNAYKPWRTHHCGVVGGCVLKMDHYCPWVNNCVGHRNYRYFLNFLMYLWCGTLFYMYFAYDVRFSAYGYSQSSEIFDFTYVLCIGIFFAMSIFLVMHGYLAMTNQSTIEMWGSRRNRKFIGLSNIRRPYSLGCWKNLQEIYGYGPWYLWLFPSTRNPPGNGYVYPLRKEVEEILHINPV